MSDELKEMSVDLLAANRALNSLERAARRGLLSDTRRNHAALIRSALIELSVLRNLQDNERKIGREGNT